MEFKFCMCATILLLASFVSSRPVLKRAEDVAKTKEMVKTNFAPIDPVTQGPGDCRWTHTVVKNGHTLYYNGQPCICEGGLITCNHE